MGEALTIEARHEHGYPVVTVAGEIDIATATRLRERLAELAASGRPLVADLDQVRFIDSAGLPRTAAACTWSARCGPLLRPTVRVGNTPAIRQEPRHDASQCDPPGQQVGPIRCAAAQPERAVR